MDFVVVSGFNYVTTKCVHCINFAKCDYEFCDCKIIFENKSLERLFLTISLTINCNLYNYIVFFKFR